MRYQTPLVVVMVAIVASLATFGVTYSSTNLTTVQNTGFTGYHFMSGHAELILRDMDGNIKAYSQSDNVITNVGDRCASERLFEAGSLDVTDEDCGDGRITFIGIANGTGITETDASDIDDYGTVAAGGTQDIMAVLNATSVTLQATASGPGIDTVITNADHLFTFDADSGVTTNNNDTTITNVFLTDALCGQNAFGECTSKGALGMEIFATRDASLAVNDGDTLQVTWTITVGGTN